MLTGLRCSLKRSLSRRFVSPLFFVAAVTVYHVNDVFRVTVYILFTSSYLINSRSRTHTYNHAICYLMDLYLLIVNKTG